MVMRIAPCARLNPAESAIALPKFLRSRMPFTRGSPERMSEIADHVRSVLPSSTKISSYARLPSSA